MFSRIGLIVGKRQQVNQTGKMYKRHFVTYWWYYRPQWEQSWWVRGSDGRGPDWDRDSHRGKPCPLPSPSLCRCSESCPHQARCTGCCWKNRELDLELGHLRCLLVIPSPQMWKVEVVPPFAKVRTPRHVALLAGGNSPAVALPVRPLSHSIPMEMFPLACN